MCGPRVLSLTSHLKQYSHERCFHKPSNICTAQGVWQYKNRLAFILVCKRSLYLLPEWFALALKLIYERKCLFNRQSLTRSAPPVTKSVAKNVQVTPTVRCSRGQQAEVMKPATKTNKELRSTSAMCGLHFGKKKIEAVVQAVVSRTKWNAARVLGPKNHTRPTTVPAEKAQGHGGGSCDRQTNIVPQ